MKRLIKLIWEGPDYNDSLLCLFNIKFAIWAILELPMIVKDLNYLTRHNCW